MGGTMVADDESEDHDVVALGNGYISVTPVHYDLTAYKYFTELLQWNLNKAWKGDA